ncbi:hypothetical protein [Janthinobacterium sp.]|uniref:response regulator n=1 Tax=Janthinobacterium sp. TaxID=1871054 RepID=UPI002588D9BE|nr:hypothetical protein [Janthinobacterium sp.]MCX7290930.1 hypothetical protein [Janthinobacterium sp.]
MNMDSDSVDSDSAAKGADEPDWLVDDSLGKLDAAAGPATAAPCVHVVTKFALSQASFQGRRLSFLHAYSGAEALALLRSTPDIAVVLLDVIMETQDAGLQVARQVREELHNSAVRIILRTGQPGQALEHRIIIDYDINDFWCKTDLTTRKLFTTVIASLRTYASLREAQQQVASLAAALAQCGEAPPAPAGGTP